MKEIDVTDIGGFSVGQVEDVEGGTGITVIVADDEMAAGIDVRGGGPASRDSRVLDPLAAAEAIHAVALGGGSAFGLDAAAGVQRYLEERGFGVKVGPVRVPLVCQSDIFDLLVGSATARPDAEMGYRACVAAERGNYRDGNFGAGCAATVGKAYGPAYAMKSGIGSHAVQIGDLMIGVIAVVNALGEVRDPATGSIVAGALADDGRTFRPCEAAIAEAYVGERMPLQADTPSNTTIGAIISNADLGKAQLCKVAGMAHDGLARTIYPVHTSMDGDSIYALASRKVAAPVDVVGTIAASVMAQAVLRAVWASDDAFGLPCAATVARAARPA